MQKQLIFSANYSYNHSTITDFKAEDEEKNITGKYLIEVPKNMAYGGIEWKNKYFNSQLSYNYIGSQWYDDENTILIDAYQTLDLKFSKSFARKYYASLTIQNILDNKYIDRKGYQAPGRFIIAEIKYTF
jgi:outer membrane receptor protein involved in Fe transport